MWARIAGVAAALAVAILLIALVARLFTEALRLTRTDGGATDRDPQFAEPAEGVTRPPELTEEGGIPAPSDDPSAGWDLGEQTPVDKTAEELSREAAAGL